MRDSRLLSSLFLGLVMLPTLAFAAGKCER